VYVVTVPAAEAGIALALLLTLYRRSNSLDISLWQELREPGQPQILDEPEQAFVPPEEPPPTWPKLPPAGVEPPHTNASDAVEPETSHA
jgi:NADH-quinone oxidoreductase subunit K